MTKISTNRFVMNLFVNYSKIICKYITSRLNPDGNRIQQVSIVNVFLEIMLCQIIILRLPADQWWRGKHDYRVMDKQHIVETKTALNMSTKYLFILHLKKGGVRLVFSHWNTSLVVHFLNSVWYLFWNRAPFLLYILDLKEVILTFHRKRHPAQTQLFLSWK